MDENLFQQLSLTDKEAFIRRQGSFVEAEDYYSFRVFLYVIEDHHVEVVYDDEEHVVSVEFVEQKDNRNGISSQLESYFDDDLSKDD